MVAAVEYSDIDHLRRSGFVRRFVEKIRFPDVLGGCWLWAGAATAKGYGRVKVRGRIMLPHRLMWALANDTPCGNRHICHACDNPQCVNPAHLFAGTSSENMIDAADKGRTTKLTRHQQSAVLELLDQGIEKRAVGKLFGVSESAIRRIVRRLRG